MKWRKLQKALGFTGPDKVHDMKRAFQGSARHDIFDVGGEAVMKLKKGKGEGVVLGKIPK